MFAKKNYLSKWKEIHISQWTNEENSSPTELYFNNVEGSSLGRAKLTPDRKLNLHKRLKNTRHVKYSGKHLKIAHFFQNISEYLKYQWEQWSIGFIAYVEAKYVATIAQKKNSTTYTCNIMFNIILY